MSYFWHVCSKKFGRPKQYFRSEEFNPKFRKSVDANYVKSLQASSTSKSVTSPPKSSLPAINCNFLQPGYITVLCPNATALCEEYNPDIQDKHRLIFNGIYSLMVYS